MAAGLVELLMFLATLGENGGGAAPSPGPMPGPMPMPGPSPMPGPPMPGPAPGPPRRVVPIRPPGPGPRPGPRPVIEPIKPGPWPTPVKPATLPPFPGPGWTSCATTPAIIARAQYWNPLLWNYATQSIRRANAQEQLGGQWVTFAAAWHPDSSGTPHKLMATEAWCLSSGPQPGPLPAPPPPGPLNSVNAVGPEPALGAWQNDRAYIGRYQAALTLLSFTHNKPAWNTHGVDGGFGPHTKAAVSAFQVDAGLPVDGEVGSQTSSAIDSMLGYPVPAGGYPPPGGGGAPQDVQRAAYQS